MRAEADRILNKIQVLHDWVDEHLDNLALSKLEALDIELEKCWEVVNRRNTKQQSNGL